MHPKITLYRRNLICALIMLSFSFAFAVTSTSTIFAQLAAQPRSNLRYSQVKQKITVETPKDNIFPPSIPLIDFTPVATLYFPIIIYEPPAIPAGCNPTGGTGGLSPGTYNTTVAGLNAIVVVGKGYNPQVPTFLGFNIHGDGGAYDMIDGPGSELNKFANEHGWILVSPLAPNGQSWWRDWVGDHNEKLADVFDTMFAQYNVCRDIVFGTTGSGGSEFWTSYFFPAKGGEYPAHTLVACGGNDGHDSTSRKQIIDLGKEPGVVARSSFYYVYGSEDDLVPSIEGSIEIYSNAGFNVSLEKIQGAGHCNRWKEQNLPTWHERTAAYWAELVEAMGAAVY